MISVLTAAQALQKTATSLSVTSAPVDLNDLLIAQAARRAIHIMAPCTINELVRALVESLIIFTKSFAELRPDSNPLVGQVETILEELIVFGDILEMRSNSDQSWSQRSQFVVRPAPPSFVVRSNGSIVILGVAGDHISPLTSALESRVTHRGTLRIIVSSDDQDLELILKELGLLKLPEKLWLRLPKIESPNSYIDFWARRIQSAATSSPITDLSILDTSQTPLFYKGRWRDVEHRHNGLYVARRPQRYGSDHWSLVEIEAGTAKRLIDIAAPGDRLRPVDVAWRIQAAFDALAGAPQQYRRVVRSNSTSLLSFYSPLPSWAERHLSIAGNKLAGERCLFSYEFSNSEIDNEVTLLRNALWMTERTN